MSLVKYWVPFCKVTTVGVEQPASARKATAASGKLRILIFINTSNNAKKNRLCRLVPWNKGKFDNQRKLPNSAAAYPFPFAPGTPWLVSVRITSTHFPMALFFCD
jgi:hypothetical protein